MGQLFLMKWANKGFKTSEWGMTNTFPIACKEYLFVHGTRFRAFVEFRMKKCGIEEGRDILEFSDFLYFRNDEVC